MASTALDHHLLRHPGHVGLGPGGHLLAEQQHRGRGSRPRGIGQQRHRVLRHPAQGDVQKLLIAAGMICLAAAMRNHRTFPERQNTRADVGAGRIAIIQRDHRPRSSATTGLEAPASHAPIPVSIPPAPPLHPFVARLRPERSRARLSTGNPIRRPGEFRLRPGHKSPASHRSKNPSRSMLSLP